MRAEQPVWTLALIDEFRVIRLQRPSSADCAMRPVSERVIAIRQTGGVDIAIRDELRRSIHFRKPRPVSYQICG